MRGWWWALMVCVCASSALGAEWQTECFRCSALVRETGDGAELVYDFGSNDGSYAICQKRVEAPAKAEALELCIKKPADHGLNLRVWDQYGECFQKPVGVPACADWQQITVALDGYPEHWGGDQNGVFDGPPSAIGFAVTKGMSAGSKGVFAFRDLRFVSLPPAEPQRHIAVTPDWTLREGKAVFEVALSGDAGPAVLFAEFRDSRGRLAGLETRRVTIPEGGTVSETFVRPVELMLEGTFYTDAAPWIFASATEPGPAEERRSVCAVKPPSGAVPASGVSGTALGMGVYLCRRRDPAGDHEDLRRTAALAAAAGVRWIREEFTWPAIEKEKGRPDFAFYDRLVREARAAGLNICGLICYYADWAAPASEEANDEFCRFAGQLAARYKNDVRYWEIWNEPNGGFYPWDMDRYFDLHRRCSEAIKKADPSLQVIGCSSAAGDPDFIRRAAAAGCRFDIASSHPYRTALVDPLLTGQLADTVSAAAEGGNPGRVWLTEMGWPTHLGGGQPERRQAEYLVRAYMDALSVPGVENVTWYDFIDDGDDTGEMEHNFGIVHRDRRLKPAFLAYRTMALAVGDKRYAASPFAGEGITARLWKGESQAVCLWPEQQGWYLTDCPGGCAVTDIYGEPLPAPVFLQAGQPVFVTGRDLTGLCARRLDAHFDFTLQAGEKTRPALPVGMALKAVYLPEGVRFRDGVIWADKDIREPAKAYFEAGGCPLTVDALPENLFVP
ncbi:MAG: cellulase family glycosylhydrolase [Abditibacteriota bacterium]|nr:cellulase family glycosylhydrolase [Abditibacteriota bacterium]